MRQVANTVAHPLVTAPKLLANHFLVGVFDLQAFLFSSVRACTVVMGSD
jgi:hypothetical protein